MLRIANWAFNHWVGRHLACDAGPLCRVPHRNFGCRRARTSLGMGSPLEALAVRKPQVFNRGHSRVYNDCFPARGQFPSVGGRRSTNDVCFFQAVQMKNWLLPLSLGGAELAAVCCLTAFLPWLFSPLGISGALGYVYRDYVLLPILAGFLILTGYAKWRHTRAK